MYSKVTYTGRYKSQFTVKTKGQRLIFNAFGITEEGLDSDDGKTEELLSWDGSATTCAKFLDANAGKLSTYFRHTIIRIGESNIVNPIHYK